MSELETRRKSARENLNAANAIMKEFEGKEMPEEKSQEATRLLGLYDADVARIEMIERLNAGEKFMGESVGTKAAHTNWRPSAPDEGMVEVDPQSWRELEVKSPWGETRTVRYNLPEAVSKKDYGSAFEAYMRKGRHELGPQDRKTLTEGTDTAGGYLVPEDFHAELLKKTATMATVRSNAMVVQTSRDIAKWPKINYTTDDKYTSGVRLTWTGESPSSSTVHRVTDPVFGVVSIPVHTAMASMPVSNDLLEDAAFDVYGLSSELLAEAFALGENDAFWNGNGVARPMGILTEVDGNGPASVASGATATLTSDGLISLAGALPSQYEFNARWYMAKSTETAIRKLVGTTSGDYQWPVVQQVGQLGPARPEILGYQVVRDDFVPAVTTDGYPIAFGDMRSYVVLDRVGFSVQRLDELYAETNLALILARKRVGGYLAQPWRLRVQKVASS